jgi:hypothetical protein
VAYTNPPTVAATDVITADLWNDYIKANEDYLKAAVDALVFFGVRVDRNASVQSISNNTWTEVSFTRELIDQGAWITVTDTDLVLPAAGIPSGYTTVQVTAHAFAKFAANTTGQRGMRVLRGGSLFVENYMDATGASTTSIAASMWTTGVSGSIFTMEVFQNSGGNLDLSDVALALSIDRPIS